jgi:CheY-like chemotaxis protein
LVVEDNGGDILLIEELLGEIGSEISLNVARDGDEALEFLRRRGKHTAAPRPDLILLDLNLPRRDGAELLEQLKGDRELLNIPVVVLTSSKSLEDVNLVYSLHANCCITKPLDLARLSEVLRSIELFWLQTVTLPTVQTRP